jgi:putative phosphoribosyl transferase
MATRLSTRPTQRIRIAGLEGLLSIPQPASGIVIFAHGSGSGRLSSRNNQVADGLHEAGFATLLIDLLTPDEEQDRARVFDIPLLAVRLAAAARWTDARPDLDKLPIGFFGASTGAGAALLAASQQHARLRAVVSRGGRPALAGSQALARVRVPTLMIVGGRDLEVLHLNRAAARHLSCEHEIAIVPGATHLFEEPGALEAVIDHARRWFHRYLGGE